MVCELFQRVDGLPTLPGTITTHDNPFRSFAILVFRRRRRCHLHVFLVFYAELKV